MADYNKIIMLGNLTRDPVLKHLPSQTVVVEFGLATNRKWKPREGAEREDVCFVDCVAFAHTGNAINKYGKKGNRLLVEGRLTFDQWETPDGTKRSKHKIAVESVTFLDKGTTATAPAIDTPEKEDGIPF